MSKQLFRVFVQPRKGRQKPVATVLLGKIPATWEHDDQTWYFVTADLTARTVTYAEVKPEAVAA